MILPVFAARVDVRGQGVQEMAIQGAAGECGAKFFGIDASEIGLEAQIDLSITDDWPLAQAFVIISAVVPAKP